MGKQRFWIGLIFFFKVQIPWEINENVKTWPFLYPFICIFAQKKKTEKAKMRCILLTSQPSNWQGWKQESFTKCTVGFMLHRAALQSTKSLHCHRTHVFFCFVLFYDWRGHCMALCSYLRKSISLPNKDQLFVLIWELSLPNADLFIYFFPPMSLI